MAILAVTSLAFAQGRTTDGNGQNDSREAKSDKPIAKLAGCLNKGDEQDGGFQLTTNGKRIVDIQGAENLAGYTGHVVIVEGTWAKSDPGKASAKSDPGKEGGTKGHHAGKLRVMVRKGVQRAESSPSLTLKTSLPRVANSVVGRYTLIGSEVVLRISRRRN